MKNNIRKARLAMNLSQMQLAKIIGTQQKRISQLESIDFERGLIGNPRLKTLWQYADTLNVSIDYLVGRTDIE